MKCPDCGGLLDELSVGGFDKSYRCFMCGGFFIQAWVVNRLTSLAMGQWKKVQVDENRVRMSTNTCPTDGVEMKRFTGESIPTNLVIEQCDKCGWWWFPMDNLFKYKEAQEAKISYFKIWGKAGDLRSLALPVLSVLLLIAGISYSVQLLRYRQQAEIMAGEQIQQVTVIKAGDGEVILNFSGPEGLTQVEIRKRGEPVWWVKMVEYHDGRYTVKAGKLEPGNRYQMRAGEVIYAFDFN